MIDKWAGAILFFFFLCAVATFGILFVGPKPVGDSVCKDSFTIETYIGMEGGWIKTKREMCYDGKELNEEVVEPVKPAPQVLPPVRRPEPREEFPRIEV